MILCLMLLESLIFMTLLISKYQNRLEEILENIDKSGYDEKLMEFAEEFLIEK